MKRIIPLIFALLITTVLVAQQRGGRGNGPANGPGTGTPPTGPESTISGTVVEFTAGAGLGMPTLVVRSGSTDTALVLGPYRVLAAAGFSAKAGDLVEATVVACTECPTGFAVITIRNLTNGTSAELRGADGTPHWDHRGHGRGMNHGCLGPDMTKAEPITGTIQSFTGGPGIGQPVLVVKTAAGERTVMVSPYRAIIEAGWEFKTGALVTVVAAPDAAGSWVAISIKDEATGMVLLLRDAKTGRC